MIRVAVTGGREFADRMLLDAHLDRIHAERGIGMLIDGGSGRGADLIAREWVRRTGGVAKRTIFAKWRTYGNDAGAIRNERILRNGRPDVVVACRGGKWTADLVRRAAAAGIEIVRVRGAR